MRRLVVVSAGLSQPSSTRLLADQIATAVRRHLPVEVHTIELREYAHDVVNMALTGFPSAALSQVLDELSKADGVVAVSPVFNASYSGLFKSFFDVVHEGSLVDKPVLVAATGGTARHSLALEHAMRPMFTYLRAVVVPTSIYAASSDWGDTSSQDALAKRVERAAGELAREMARRGPATVADPFEDPTPFSELLSDT